MSLFNICHWWSTQCSDIGENYDVTNLLCARFGLDDHEKDYVVVSSHAGYLSIYYPNMDMNRSGNCYKPTDLLLEIQLGAPVLGVYAGRFSSNSRNESANQLAVLHASSIAIYNVEMVGGVAEHGTQLRLHVLVEYKFARTAFAFCKGHFGQVKGREFFCVVHLDGTLIFYEQDGISYECQFPGQRALPAPVVYCERTDSFIRFSDSWNLECFTYQDLSHSSINKSRYQPIWSVSIGEGIIDMCVVQAKQLSASIMILGERNFISLSDNGKVNFIMKLDYAPKCFHSFVVGYYWEPTARLISVIVSEASKLFIYEDANIIWAAQHENEAPVAIQRSNLSGLAGGIVTLGPSGQLRVGYLGSDVFNFKVPPLNIKEITFSQAHKELVQLEEEIKAAVDVCSLEDINRAESDDVRIQFSINSEVSEDTDAMLLDVPADVALKNLPTCTGSLKLKYRVDLAEIQVTFNMPEGVRCSQETFTRIDVPAGATEAFQLDFYVAELVHVHSTRVDAIVSFLNTQGIPRVMQQTCHLPLKMFFKAQQPQKASGIKLTFNVVAPSLAPKLSTFFPDFITWESDVHALGLALLCPGDGKSEEMITVVGAKNSNRLRIQSDSLETFPLILERILNVALEHDKSKNDSNSKQKNRLAATLNPRTTSIMATPTIPTQQILHRMDVHHETQENIRKQTIELDELWNQFKTLQRKLQEKSEDEPKETLVIQIEENYDRLIAEGDKLVEMRNDERRQRCSLSCAVNVAKLIISCLKMDEKAQSVVLSMLCVPVEDWMELSWEESMSPGVDMLHHYGPLNRDKDATNRDIADANSAGGQFDYIRFRRHFAMLLERVTRVTLAKDETQPTRQMKRAAKSEVDLVQLSQLLETDSVDGGRRGSVNKLRSMAKHNTLEAVEDDEEEYDEEDLRKVGYKKNYGPIENNATKESAWLNEDYELPSSEELFNDLGIWW